MVIDVKIFDLCRHDMLFFNEQYREYLIEEAERLNPGLPEDLISEVLRLPIPAIVKSQEYPQDNMHNGLIEVGFSSHLRRNGTRVRIKSVLPSHEIKRVVTAFDAFRLYPNSKNENIIEIFHELDVISAEYSIDIGVFGSCALEFITAMPYITPNSDIDLSVKGGKEYYRAFYDRAMVLSAKHGIDIDIEVQSEDGGGIKLAELLSNKKTVLCKTLYGAELREA